MAENTREDLGDRVEAVRRLLKEFKLERYMYLAAIGVCLVVLLISAIIAAVKAEFDYVTVIGMFGPSGVIASMAGRLLAMWNRATQIVFKKDA